METSSREQIINELKARIKLLEKQKSGAEQQMREKLLLSVVSESIEKATDPEVLLTNVLERLSIVLDVSLSACCEITHKKLKPIEVYNFPVDRSSKKCGFSISSQISSELAGGPIFLQKGSEKFNEINFSKEFKSVPHFIALFPFQTLYIPFGCFIFFEYERKREQFTSFSMVIQHLIHFATDRYEKLKLTQELKDLNLSFDDQVNKRTESLKSKYEEIISGFKDEFKKQSDIEIREPVPNASLQNLFLRNVGVEIRTPLNGVMGFAELMRGNDLDKSEQNNYIDIIKSCGKSLMKIVDDAQVYAAIRSLQVQEKKTEFHLASFMTDLYDEYKNDELFRQRENLELKININISGSTEIIVDRDKLKLILSNLIGNSIKFTGSGYIEFGCSVEELKSNHGKDQLQDIVFFVKDTGIGISDEYSDYIFDEFYKVEHEIAKLYGGLGLGLTIARALVELMSGKIWFKSEPGKGSEFYFSLPDTIKLTQAELEALNGNGEENQFDWGNRKILIVEDDAMSIIYLKEALKATGAEILLAGNGKTAIELVASGTEIDIILMDIKLPGISGYEATRQIKSFSNIPIIAQTAYAMADDYKKILQVGCDDYVSKPINRRKLLKKIHNLFTSNTPAIT